MAPYIGLVMIDSSVAFYALKNDPNSSAKTIPEKVFVFYSLDSCHGLCSFFDSVRSSASAFKLVCKASASSMISVYKQIVDFNK